MRAVDDRIERRIQKRVYAETVFDVQGEQVGSFSIDDLEYLDE